METETRGALSPERFARELWGISPKDQFAEFFLIQYRPTPENPDAKKVETHYCQVGEIFSDFEAIFNHLKLKNHHYWNVHPGVNPRKIRRPRGRGRNDDVETYVALWVDLDFHDAEEAVRRRWAETLADPAFKDIPPSCVIESGHGIHAYWLLDKPAPAAAARPCLAGLQDYTKSDPINDPARVLRMPGTANVKDRNEPVECYIHEATWRRYPLEAFREFSIDPGKTQEDIERSQTEAAAGPPSRDPEIERIKEGVGEGERNNAATKLAGHYLGRGLDREETLEKLREWNPKNAKPLPDEEIASVVDSIAKKEAAKPKKEKKPRREEPWWDGGKFLPSPLADHIASGGRFLSSPIGTNGLGVQMYRYSGGAFHPNGSDFVRSEAHRILKDAAKPARISEVHDLIMNLSKVGYNRLNPKALDLICCRNGMVNWRTGEVSPHDPSHLSTIQLPVDYDPAAECPDVDTFFRDVFPEDCIALAQEFMGYLLIPTTRVEKCFIAIGEGGNGKSTFLKLLTMLLGQSNVSAISVHALEESRFAMAGLLGKLANIYHDVDSRILESTGTIKSLTSGDMLTGELKFQDSFNFSPFARLVFSGNDFPRTNDKSEAWPDRLVIVPFPHRFRESAKRIPEYEKVLAAKPGAMSRLFNLAVDGLRRVEAAGWRFSTSKTSMEALDDYRNACNPVLTFIREHCDVHPEAAGITRKDLYYHYTAWCAESGLKRMSAQTFTKVVRALRTVGETAHDGVRGWKGIQWKGGCPPATVDDEIDQFGRGSSNQQPDINF